MATEININIASDGSIRFIHNDDLVSLMSEGETSIERASHVEPYDGSGGDAFAEKYPGVWWTADMAPSDGPVLGPFATRTEALAAEVEWLRQNRGL